MLGHAWLVASLLVVSLSSSAHARRLPRSLARLSRPLAHVLMRRGLVKRSQCYFGAGVAKPKTLGSLRTYTSVIAGGSSTVLTTSTSAPTSSGALPSASASSSAPSGNATLPGSFKLTTNSEGDKFFDDFVFFTDKDPTDGIVQFQDEAAARSQKLIGTLNGEIFMKADNTTKLAVGANRASIRITSKAQFTIGQLLILDATHTPYGCATWPAFWLLGAGAEWPTVGEIDIFEGVNVNPNNQYTVHTNPGCFIAEPMPGTGTIVTANGAGASCDARGNDNAACGIKENQPNSYGDGLNNAGGGVWATLWTEEAISIWFFIRGKVPADIDAKTPDPSKWGKATAVFGSSTCAWETYFKPQEYIFDLTFCGQWAGRDNAWKASKCPGTCAETVADPTKFHDAYWIVKSVRLYTAG